MISLLPTEAWEYSFLDIIRAITAAYRSTKDVQRLYIKDIGSCIPVRSGRVGIMLSLQTLKLKKGAGVGVPLYCCPVVFKAIKMSGMRPVFLDIDASNYCIDIQDLSKKLYKIDALIAVHMFGNMCDMNTILDVIKDKPVIEDCAQSLGSRLNGKSSGSFGSISMFSFRSGKYLTAGEGGALYSANEDLCSQIEKLVGIMPKPSVQKECMHVIETYIRTKLRSQPLWGLLGHKLWAFYNKKVEFLSKSPISPGQIFSSDLKIINNRTNRLQLMIDRQRSNAEYFLKEVILPPEMFCYQPPNCYYNRFMFPIKFRSVEECTFVSDFLLKKKISTSRPYRDVIEGAAKHYDYEGDCPRAERLLNTTLVIPLHYKLRNKDLEHIAESLNLAWESVGYCSN